MRCITCGAKTIHDTTADVTDYKKCLVVVRNVPCQKCTECNEIIYTGDVVKQLEKAKESVKQSINELAVIDYENAAA
jgi:YgiT-type zinc finger domain-containing protein